MATADAADAALATVRAIWETAAVVLGVVATSLFVMPGPALAQTPAPARTVATADPLSDAPEGTRAPAAQRAPAAATYADALARWRGVADVHAWIGERFSYDPARALRLSETQRQRNGTLPITAPAEFFARPHGVCVDLARFGVETLRQLDPAARASYLMIEFDPVTLGGQTLRRHWLATFETAEGRWFFADSKRPDVLAGPYPDTRAFIAEYERYRGRRIVAFAERASFERQRRTIAARRSAASAAATPAAAASAGERHGTD